MTDRLVIHKGALFLALTLLGGCASIGDRVKSIASLPAISTAQEKPVTDTAPALQQTPKQVADSYYQGGAAQLAALKAVRNQRGQAKNIILMVGDGMGVSTVTAGRIYAGQVLGVDGESHVLEMEKLPHTAFARPYPNDSQVPDSASTITAILSGSKANLRTLGVDQSVPYADCKASKGREMQSLFELAEMAGKSTGLVSTARVTHATPAGVYGHAANRGWELDSVMSPEDIAEGCVDLARQLLEWPYGDGLEVALGGGRENFLPKEQADPEYENKTGKRSDGRNLARQWSSKDGHSWIWNMDQFAKTDFTSPQKVLGLFEPSHMNYDADRAKDGAGEPSLAEMTRAAITRLQQNNDGYILLVESGRIDMASHGNNAARMVQDMVAFDEAVKVAREMTSSHETLLIVTADHSHGLTINGYPKRNHPILGLTVSPDGKPMKGADGKAYTTLLYSTGPGSNYAPAEQYRTIVPGTYSLSSEARPDDDYKVSRPDPEAGNTEDLNYQQQALVPLRFSMHTGEDVPVFAEGPSAWLVRGAIEQHTLFHIMAYAAGLAGYAVPE